MSAPTISIIIPTLNECNNLARSLASCYSPAGVEIIVVDGGSSDGTPQITLDHGARHVSSKPGRGRQMNVGARMAAGEILLFLHADTTLPPAYHPQVIAVLEKKGTVAGAFRLRIDGGGVSLRIIEWAANLRSKFLQLPFGDQALFVPRKWFEKAGGFPEIPIMEDFELVRVLRRKGKIELAEGSVVTSGRRWEKYGPWRTTLRNQLVIVAHFLGVSLETIARLYHRKPGP